MAANAVANRLNQGYVQLVLGQTETVGRNRVNFAKLRLSLGRSRRASKTVWAQQTDMETVVVEVVVVVVVVIVVVVIAR